MRKLRIVLATVAVATFASGAMFTASAATVAPNANSIEVVTPWKDATCGNDQFLALKVDPPARGPAGPAGQIIISNLDSDSFDWAIARIPEQPRQGSRHRQGWPDVVRGVFLRRCDR